jgi:hypothetical protein
MTTPVAAEKAPSFFEDLLEIFISPTAVFERRRETPAFGLALVILIVLLVGLTFAFKDLMSPLLDAEFDRGMQQAMKQNPNLTPEMMQQGRAIGEKFMVVGVGLYALVAPIATGIVLWFAAKLLESSAQIGQAVMVAVYAMFPRVVESIVNAIQLLVLPEGGINGRYSLSLGPARFLDPDTANPLLLAILGRVDLITIWVVVLLAIGISVMGKIPRSRAAIAAVVAWIIGTLPGVWGALRTM